MTDRQQQTRKQKAQQAQAKAQINRDKARRKLLRQRTKLAQRRARNRRQSEKRRADSADEGNNPTAHSTLPPQKSNAENVARNSHSTVPAAPKYSDVSARERLFGLRFHRKTSSGEGEASAPSSDSSDGPTGRDGTADTTNDE